MSENKVKVENKVKIEWAGWESLIVFTIMLASISTCTNSALTESYTEEMKNDVKEIKEYVMEIKKNNVDQI